MSCSIAGGAGPGAGPGPVSGSGSGFGALDSGSRVSGVGAGSEAGSVVQSLEESPVASTYSTSSRGDPELELQARLFRDLMSEARPAQALASWSALRSTTGPYDPATDDSILGRGGYGSSEGQQHLNAGMGRSEVDVASLLSIVQPSIATGPDQAAAVADPEPTFAELIERHVRRTLAATRDGGRGADNEVRLELTDAVLPETSLSLRRSGGGWQLVAMSANRDSLERVEQFAPGLVERFATASLGSLEVVTRLEATGECRGAR